MRLKAKCISTTLELLGPLSISQAAVLARTRVESLTAQLEEMAGRLAHAEEMAERVAEMEEANSQQNPSQDYLSTN